MTPLSVADAEAIWAVLVEHAGASDDPLDAAAFVQHQTTTVEREWRFIGRLGFGGKFRRNRVWIGADLRETWTVDCYREDETPERLAIISNVNARLAAIKGSAEALTEALEDR